MPDILASHEKPASRLRLPELLRFKVSPDEQNFDEYRVYLVTYYSVLFAILVHFALSVTFSLVKEPGLMLFNLGSVAAWVGAWVLNQRRRYVSAVLIMSVEVVVQCSVMVLVMGWSGGFQYYLLPAIPFVLFNIHLKDRISFPLAFGFGTLFVGLHWLSTVAVPATFTLQLITAMHYANTIFCMAALVIVSYFFRLATMLNDRRLRETAHTDFLTGLRNRRSMMDLLEQQRLVTQREGSSFGVLLIDIDHFKAFNDRYGHDCGDYVLSEVARVMQRSIRESDAVARWGGEEFLVMTPNTDIQGTHTVAEGLRAAIERWQMRFMNQDLNVSVTVGVAIGQDHNQSLEDTLKLADKALYCGKELGRNRVQLSADIRE